MEKMGNNLNRHFTKDDMQMTNKHMKMEFEFLSYHRNAKGNHDVIFSRIP